MGGERAEARRAGGGRVVARGEVQVQLARAARTAVRGAAATRAAPRLVAAARPLLFCHRGGFRINSASFLSRSQLLHCDAAVAEISASSNGLRAQRWTRQR